MKNRKSFLEEELANNSVISTYRKIISEDIELNSVHVKSDLIHNEEFHIVNKVCQLSNLIGIDNNKIIDIIIDKESNTDLFKCRINLLNNKYKNIKLK